MEPGAQARVRADICAPEVARRVTARLGMQGVADDFFSEYFGYPAGFPSTTLPNQRTLISSPLILNQLRDFFSCPTFAAAEFEEDGDPGSVGAHWEERIHEVSSHFLIYRHVQIHALQLLVPLPTTLKELAQHERSALMRMYSSSTLAQFLSVSSFETIISLFIRLNPSNAR